MTGMTAKGNLDVELVPGFFKQAHRKECCGSLINTVLCIPEVHVLAVGPESCLRVIYFRALRQQLYENLLMKEGRSQSFIPFPYVALSGREFANMNYEYIGRGGFDYIKRMILEKSDLLHTKIKGEIYVK
ncbi:MAG: hypothetical protein RO469_10225 [Thermincola sp.]|jgi:hypothetical protein|nr:hypothetical protein [Thermincola sp.]MDT3702559.1 hypothetical protein [Thermincola sp.]